MFGNSNFLKKYSAAINDNPRIILLNGVHDDGMGDFYHFLDIYKALKANPKFERYDFISLIACWPQQYEIIQAQLKIIGIDQNHLFLGDWPDFGGKFLADKILLHHISKATQMIQISYSHFPHIQSYLSLNKNINYKLIPEHEYRGSIALNHGATSYSLGLGPGCLGIKLKRNARVLPAEALSLIQKNNPGFSRSLLNNIQLTDYNDFDEHFLLIPAYFNKMRSFVEFITFLAINEKLFPDKDIAIFASGKGLREGLRICFDKNASFESIKKTFLWLKGDSDFSLGFHLHIKGHLANDTTVKKIELVEPNQSEPLILEFNPNGTRIIRIFYGYMLTDDAYCSLYKQAILAGVSGDNTFELSVSCQTLPWYDSTNSHIKKNTYFALLDIVKKLPLDAEIKDDFTTYFDNMLTWGTGNASAELTGQFKLLDLPKMITSWPVIAEHLIQFHNFYDKLDEVVLSLESSSQLKMI